MKITVTTPLGKFDSTTPEEDIDEKGRFAFEKQLLSSVTSGAGLTLRHKSGIGFIIIPAAVIKESIIDVEW